MHVSHSPYVHTMTLCPPWHAAHPLPYIPLSLQHRPPLQPPLTHWLDAEQVFPADILLEHLPPDR